MRLPDFLIIGAMKAGSTTLFRDLEVNPACFFSLDKEPHNLIHESVLTPEGRSAYGALFEKARPDQVCAEASTGYTKRPLHEGVAGRARSVLGDGLRLIYLVREPVSRTLSHHYHALTYGETNLPVDEAVRTLPDLVNFSRYAWQLEPWLAEFPRSQILILRFETYTRERKRTIEEVSRFLGIPPRPDLVDEEAVYNKGDQRPIHRGLWTSIYRSPLYRNGLRAIIPRRARDLFRRLVLPKGPERPNPPAPATVDYILEQVREDCDRLRALMGLEVPVWELDKVRQKYAPGPGGSPATHQPSGPAGPQLAGR